MKAKQIWIALAAVLSIIFAPVANARENMAAFWSQESYASPVQHFTNEVAPRAAVRAGRAIATGYNDIAIIIVEAAQRHGVPANLALGVARVESRLNPRAHSPSGAIGLMQVMPSTARGLGCRGSLYNASANADCGVRYLAQIMSDTGGNLRLTAARYNQGRFSGSNRAGARYADRVLAQPPQQVAYVDRGDL